MPAFEFDPNQPGRPFMHTNIAGDITKQPYMDSMAEQGMTKKSIADSRMKMLKMALKKRKMEKKSGR